MLLISGNEQRKSVGEMPSHNHSGSTNTAGNHTHGYGGRQYGADAYSRRDANVPEDWKSWQTSSAGDHSHSVTISNTGENNAHNNMQPYLSIYVWKRTA